MSGRALLLAPEPPYPMIGGGALRTASIAEYLKRRFALDIITFRQPGALDPDQATWVIDLPYHGKSGLARTVRNARRAIAGRPPLLDRFSGFDRQISDALRSTRYDVAIVEHFWCAGYADLIRSRTSRMLLDLHNVESVWHRTAAGSEPFPRSALHRRFAGAYKALERRFLPKFDALLVTSDEDAERIAPMKATVYPNALPHVTRPAKHERDCILFTGNLEYGPNVSAVRYFKDAIWPGLKERWPELVWEIAGKSPEQIQKMVAGDARITVSGPMANAYEKIASAKVVVVPLLAGSGTRVKILEAWAAGTAIVSTTIGAEGLNARAGQHLLIADDPGDFANSVSSLLESIELRGKLSDAGRFLYEERFTWATVWKVLDGVI